MYKMYNDNKGIVLYSKPHWFTCMTTCVNLCMYETLTQCYIKTVGLRICSDGSFK